MIVVLPVPEGFAPDFLFRRRSNGTEENSGSAEVFGDCLHLRFCNVELADGDYYIELSQPMAVFCCRVENQVATIADFWPQLDMLRAMQTGKAYNWTNQANEVLRVAIEEAP